MCMVLLSNFLQVKKAFKMTEIGAELLINAIYLGGIAIFFVFLYFWGTFQEKRHIEKLRVW